MPSDSTDIFKFQGFRDYLRHCLEERKATRRGTGSLRSLAARSGFRSPSTISMFASGMRVPNPIAADKLACGLGLAGRQRKYFITLAALEAASSERERSEAHARLVKLRAMTDESLLECRQYRFLSDPLYPILYCLMGVSGIDQSPEALAAVIPDAKASRVEKTLLDLQGLGLIHKDADGGFSQTQKMISTADCLPDGAQDAAFHGYHKHMLVAAAAALELSREEREMNGLTIAIPRSQLPVVKERIRRFRRAINETMSRFDEADDVYQLNIQFFPLTRMAKQEKRK
jgi:uncharacterized protein (TIGR02147 family)